MSHTQKKELNKIVLGSMDFYVVPWTGEIPADEELEKDENMIGRTKNGATVSYTANWYLAESDDGKAKKRKLISENASISYGNITRNAKTLNTLIATARTAEKDGKRTTKIGGVENDKGLVYLIRGVHKDKVDGDIRITGIGVNTGGWESMFSPTGETIVTPTFELNPIDDEGTLLIYEEEVIEESEEYKTASATSGTPVAKISTAKSTDSK